MDGASSFTYRATSYTPVEGDAGYLAITMSSGITLGMSQADKIGALLVLANVQVTQMYIESFPYKNSLVVLAIQIQGSDGVWHTLERTRRSLSQADQDETSFTGDGGSLAYTAGSWLQDMDFDIPLRTLISESDVPYDPPTVFGVRVVIRGAQAATGLPGSAWWEIALNDADELDAHYTTQRANLSVIPFHALAVMS